MKHRSAAYVLATLTCVSSACATATATSPATATVVPFAEATTKTSPSESAKVWLLAHGDNAFVGRLEMDPGVSIPEHRDATEEYIHILEGSGRIHIDDRTYEVQPGTTIFMPAGSKVRFDNGSKKLVGLQVFAGPEPAKKYDAWRSDG